MHATMPRRSISNNGAMVLFWHDLTDAWHSRRLRGPRQRCAIDAKNKPGSPMSLVTDIPFADFTSVEQRYAERLTFETDCWDVHESIKRGKQDFVVLDVRGPQLYETSHVPGAINLPHG